MTTHLTRDELERERRKHTLTLPYPPSSNRYWRVFRGRATKSSEARKYQLDAGMVALAAGITSPRTALLSVVLRVFRPIKSGDLDNRIKVVLDSLNGIAWEDDKQIVEIHAYRFDDKHHPRVEVEISGA